MDTCMQGYGRNCGAFQSNRLKSKNPSAQDRFNDLNRSELESRLERLADVRCSVVARGKALIANPQYPDKQIVWKISHLLAARLIP